MQRIGKTIAIASAVFIAINLAALLVTPPKVSHRERAKLQRKMSKVKPDIVFLGNSMLGVGLDAGTFARAFHKKVIKIDKGGSASAAWYLTFKNVIAKAKKKPSYTVIFYRNYFLTMPEYRVEGRYMRYVRGLAGKNEPLLERLSYKTDPADIFLSRIFPLFRNRSEIRDGIDTFIKETCISGLMGKDGDFAQNAVASVFQDKNMDPALLTKKQLAAESSKTDQQIRFADVVENSYLPAIIAEAKHARIRLIFVRVKRRRDAEGKPEPPALTQYTVDLKQYLLRQNIPLIDFTAEPLILPEHFGAGDHLDKENGRPLFTNLLIQRIEGYIRLPASTNKPR